MGRNSACRLGAVILAVTLHTLWLVYPPAEVSKAAFPSDLRPWYCLEVGSINFFVVSLQATVRFTYLKQKIIVWFASGWP